MNFNILGIGLPQLILVFGLSMLLFGPKKMIQYAYQAGRWISQLRLMWEEAAKSVQKEFHEAGLDLPADLPIRGGRIDIGAAAMRIVEQAATPSATTTAASAPTIDQPTVETTEAPFTTLAESSRLRGPDSVLSSGSMLSQLPPTEQLSLNYPAATESPSPALSTTPEVNPQTNTRSESEQGKKYDAWLPD